MDATEMHERAQSVFADVLTKVTEDDLVVPTPCTEWTVADLIDHVVDGNLAVGEHMGDKETARPTGDRLAVQGAAAVTANAAFSKPAWQERFIEMPFGPLPAPVFANIRSGDVYIHAWDLATAIGAETDLDPELSEAIFAAVAPVVVSELRGDGRPFAEE